MVLDMEIGRGSMQRDPGVVTAEVRTQPAYKERVMPRSNLPRNDWMHKTVSATDLFRFWSKVDMRGQNECWPFMGTRDEHGYGRFGVGGTGAQSLAHRYAYIILVGIPDKGLCVLHRCDNPPCCNPSHLFPGTRKDNIFDMIEKGRQRHFACCGEFHGCSKLTQIMVDDIRNRAIIGDIDYVKEAERCGVSPSAIRKVVLHETWRKGTKLVLQKR